MRNSWPVRVWFRSQWFLTEHLGSSSPGGSYLTYSLISSCSLYDLWCAEFKGCRPVWKDFSNSSISEYGRNLIHFQYAGLKLSGQKFKRLPLGVMKWCNTKCTEIQTGGQSVEYECGWQHDRSIITRESGRHLPYLSPCLYLSLLHSNYFDIRLSLYSRAPCLPWFMHMADFVTVISI